MKKMPGDIILLYTHVYHKWRPYDIWFLKYKVPQTGHFGSFFTLSVPTTWKIKILKLKKPPGDIIILHICTINHNHLMYGSWDMEHGKQNFLSFMTVFCHFTPYGPRKLKFKKNGKNPEDIIILQMYTINVYTFTPPLPPITTQKIKILKNWKN